MNTSRKQPPTFFPIVDVADWPEVEVHDRATVFRPPAERPLGPGAEESEVVYLDGETPPRRA